MLHVYTSRISYSGVDRVNITRATGCSLGQHFAPSWGLLMRARHQLESEQGAIARLVIWEEYRSTYLAEMRISYRRHRRAWQELLARDRAVLVCYCTDPAMCHRRLLAQLLGKCGAVDEGELP